MRRKSQLAVVLGAILVLGLLPGCGKSSGGEAGSKDQGKTYTPDNKNSKGGGAASGSGAAPVSDADTTSGKPSAASDAGSQDATKGQAVANPGAPTAHSPGKH